MKKKISTEDIATCQRHIGLNSKYPEKTEHQNSLHIIQESLLFSAEYNWNIRGALYVLQTMQQSIYQYTQYNLNKKKNFISYFCNLRPDFRVHLN